MQETLSVPPPIPKSSFGWKPASLAPRRCFCLFHDFRACSRGSLHKIGAYNKLSWPIETRSSAPVSLSSSRRILRSAPRDALGRQFQLSASSFLSLFLTAYRGFRLAGQVQPHPTSGANMQPACVQDATFSIPAEVRKWHRQQPAYRTWHTERASNLQRWTC